MSREALASRTAAAATMRDRYPLAASGRETVLPSAIAGRTVAAPVTAPADVPKRAFATMDGFAFAAGDDDPLLVVGRVAPEDDPPSLAPGEAVRIATGAPLPDRANAVLPREDAVVDGDELAAPALAPGTHLVPAGATASAGERLFEPGDRLAPRHATLLRDVGIDSVTVRERLSVGILATGTEIHEGRQPDRDSAMLANLVRSWGHEPTVLDPVPDAPGKVREAIERAAGTFDAVFTSGGTSVGRADHVSDVLAEHDPLFAGVAIQPGRPVTAALVEGTLVCGLPGKPLAAHTAAVLVARPAFVGDGALPTVRAEPTAEVTLPDADHEFAVPVRLEDGRAEPLGHADSPVPVYDERFAPGRVASSTRLSTADGFVLATEPFGPGREVEVVPFGVVE